MLQLHGSDTLIDENTPWYRQFWPWFIFSPLIFVVCAGFWMLYIATVTHDGAVLDNYYKDGLSIIERTQQDDWAAAKNLEARVQALGNAIQLRLDGELDAPPQSLTLTYVFSTQASRDVVVTLTRASDGRYLGQLPEPVEGRRELLLESTGGDNAWRLHGRVDMPTSSITPLTPKVE